MNQAEYRAEIKLYTDVDGIVCPKKPEIGERNSTNNGLLYTSIHIINLQKNGWITEEDKQDYLKVIESCKVENNGWLLHRNPITKILNSHDDYTGVASALKLIGFPFHAAAMLRDFKERNWVLDNEFPYNPRFPKAWLGRMFGFVAHIYECGGQSPSWFHRMIVGISFRMKPSNQDDAALTYLKALCSKSKYAKEFIKKYVHQDIFCDLIHNWEHPLGRVLIIEPKV